MRRITKNQLLTLATQQSKLTKDFKGLIEKYFAQYQLKLITEKELFQKLELHL